MVTPSPATDNSGKVVVIIPTLNEAAHIKSVLCSLILDDPIASRCTVLIADGGSTDGTTDIVKTLAQDHPNMHLVHNAGRTQAAAMNMLLGPEYNSAEIIVRCDAHATYPPRFVSGVAACLDLHDAASIVIPMDAIGDTNGCFQRGLVWIADTRLGAGGAPHRGGKSSGYCDHGHHAAFAMADFRRLGGYDVRFVANEDAEYDYRLTQSGGRIWLSADHRIGYFPRGSVGRLWKQYYNYGIGRAQTCIKHRIRPGLRQLIPALHTILLILSLVGLLFSPLFLIWPILYGTIILAAGIWTSLRHLSLCGLAATPALATMHLAWGLGFLGQTGKSIIFPHANIGD